MKVSRRRFQRRRILRREKQRSSTSRHRRGLWARLTDWWNRKQFYSFHKDEIITHEQVLHTPTELKSQDEEDEWNNDSESEHEQDHYDANIEDDFSLASSERDMTKDMMDPLVTIEEDSPLDDTLDTLETIEEEYPMDESP